MSPGYGQTILKVTCKFIDRDHVARLLEQKRRMLRVFPVILASAVLAGGAAGCRSERGKASPSLGSPPSAGSSAAAPVGVPSSSSAGPPKPSVSVDPKCKEPWILLRLVPPGSKRETASLWERVAHAASLHPCTGREPRAAGEVCLLYVHFYGVKYFARENAGKNHDAFVARCFVPDDCARLAKQNDAQSAKWSAGAPSRRPARSSS